MTTVKNIADSLKEFSFDILGFLIPGFTFYVLINSMLIVDDLSVIGILDLQLKPYIIIVFSYLLGYVALGISLFVNNLLGSWSYQDIIEQRLNKEKLFNAALEKYNRQNPDSEIKEVDGIRILRTRIMSFIPEADNKIYSFRFRSDLCESTSKILFLTSFLYFLLLIIQFNSQFEIVIYSWSSIIFYAIVIILGLLLCTVRNRFYSITLRVPLSIYLSKNLKGR